MKLSSLLTKTVLWASIFVLAYMLLLRPANFYLDWMRETLLYDMCRPEKIASLKKKLEENPDLVGRKFNLEDSEVSLVHWVCRFHNLEGIQYLKALDADFSQETDGGKTPLSLLSEFFYPNTLEAIREVVASRFVGAEAIIRPNRFGTTPIMWSVRYCQSRILKEYLDILKRKGLKVDMDALLQLAVAKLRDNKDGCEMVALLVAEGARPLEKAKDGKSALDIALESKKNDFVEIMIKNNAK